MPFRSRQSVVQLCELRVHLVSDTFRFDSNEMALTTLSGTFAE